MIKYNLKTGVLTLLILIAGCSTKKETLNWYRGNLHTHSYWSDGDDFPEMIMDWYKSNGYHFIGLSDHNILAEGEKWKTIQGKEILLRGFERYLEKFGKDWVEYKQDSAGITARLKTLSEYQPLFQEEGRFLIIPSEEITDKLEGKTVHVNATNIQKVIMPQGGKTIAEMLQNNINAVIRQREETGVPILPHINHPNHHYSITAEDLIQVQGERFFEVYNGHHRVNNLGDSVHISTEEMWDVVNMAYLEKNQPLLYGVATDDCHNYHEFGKDRSNPGRGWIMVNTNSLTAESLIGAMEEGKFYASSGVTLDYIHYDKNQIRLKVTATPGVNYDIQLIGWREGDDKTSVLAHTNDTEVKFNLDETIRFARVKVLSDKLKANPNWEGEFETAWTQPVTIIKR
ncbi:MAG: hypothetical protein PHI28_15035 [Mangrovibacterium sp.]|nr:hypothetical protein [Mangrovibacterium sp.]